MDTPAPCFLLLFVAEFLSFDSYSRSCNTPGQVLTTSLLFPKGGATGQVCGLFLAHRFY